MAAKASSEAGGVQPDGGIQKQIYGGWKQAPLPCPV